MTGSSVLFQPSKEGPDGRRQGRLRVYLGYAAGVGKTYQMLSDAADLVAAGMDVVVGYFEPHGRQDTIARAQGLEVVPRRRIPYRGVSFEEMDTQAILQRRPEVCLVDELAHTNVPGSEREKRWQDVQLLLESGIGVLGTMNVQHLESLNDEVQEVTGVRVRETVPDWHLAAADEVTMVDLTPEALRNRVRRGAVYPREKAQQALERFFSEANLTALRELALRQTAHEVEEGIGGPPEEAAPDRESQPGSGSKEEPVRECVMVCLSGRPSNAALLRRGRRVADYLRADCLAVHVEARGGVQDASAEALKPLFRLAENLHIETQVLHGADVARALADYARRRGVTQLYLSQSRPGGWWARFRESLVERVVALAQDRQVIVVAREP